MTANVTSQSSAQQPVRLKKTLTLFGMVMMGLAYLQPMTVFDTFGIVTDKTNGHVMMAYVFALIAMLFTAYSYGRLVTRFPSAGSAYTYTQKTISPHLGFMVGWASMLDYLLMPMINILLARLYLEEIFPTIPPWIFVVVLTFLMTYANIRGLELVSNLNKTIVSVQILVIIVFTLIVAYKIYAQADPLTSHTLISMKPVLDSDFSVLMTISGATILCFSFLGFDGISSLTEETHNAKVVVPRAIFLTALSGGILFIIVAYFLQLYFPDTSRFTAAELDDSTQPAIIRMVTNSFWQSVVLVFSTVTVMASGLASQAGISRLMYVMGRDGVLPQKVFGQLSSKYRTPVINILISGVICLVAIEFNASLGYDLIAFGALIAFTFVNLSVFFKFYIHEKRNKSLKDHVLYLVLPLCGVITVSSLWFSLGAHAMELGLAWAALGFIYMLYLTKFFTKKMPELHEELYDEHDLHL